MTSATARRRFGWTDAAVLLGIATALLYLTWRADAVLRYKWNWSVLLPYVVRFDEAQQRWVTNLILDGLIATVRIAIWAALLAAVIGVLAGLARVSKSLFLRLLARLYVELVRNIPPLVFIFVFYFFITSQITPLLGIDEVVRGASPASLAIIGGLVGPPRFLPAIASALICLALFEGAYVAEIVRAGIQSIDRGQWEAASSLGLARRRTLRLVILPQALQRVVPPLAGQFISLVKDSSIISLISIPELTFLGSEVAASTGRLFEAWIVVALLYFLLCFGLSLAFGRLERRMGAAGR